MHHIYAEDLGSNLSEALSFLKVKSLPALVLIQRDLHSATLPNKEVLSKLFNIWFIFLVIIANLAWYLFQIQYKQLWKYAVKTDKTTTDSHTLKQQSPTFLEPGTSIVENNFSTDQGCRVGGDWDGLGMIQVFYIYRALYFYDYYISSTSEH